MPLDPQVRELLDSLGATRTRIIVTSDLDEFTIAALSGAPVDGYGVGTALVTGRGLQAPPPTVRVPSEGAPAEDVHEEQNVCYDVWLLAVEHDGALRIGYFEPWEAS